MRTDAATDTIRLLTVLAVGICLIPAGAHLFELPNKIGLPAEQYMIVQRIYAGWALFGVPIAAALLLTLAHTVLVRDEPIAFRLSLAAFALIALTQVIFWTFTYPMNVESQNWTAMPENFEVARRQWEYSHAVNALLTLGAFVAITVAAVAGRRGPKAVIGG